MVRADMNRLAAFSLMLLLDGPVDGWAQFTEAPDSTAGHHTVEAHGPGGFEARLQFDRETNRLVELTYTFPRRAAAVGTTSVRRGKGLTFTVPLIDPAYQLADHRVVEGLVLPHRIVQKLSQGTRRWLVDEYVINPPPDHPLLRLIDHD